MSLNPLTYQPHSNFQQGAAMFTASLVQLLLKLLVCDRSVSVNIITHTFVGLKCLTETKIQILCDHVDHTRFHIVEMGCQMVQFLSAHIVTLYNVCSVHRGMFSTSGVFSTSGDTMSTLEGYHEYIGGIP